MQPAPSTGIVHQPAYARRAEPGVLIAYLRSQAGRIVHTDQLMIVARIGECPRRIRKLRALHGWAIMSRMALRDILHQMRERQFRAEAQRTWAAAAEAA